MFGICSSLDSGQTLFVHFFLKKKSTLYFSDSRATKDDVTGLCPLWLQVKILIKF